MADSGYPDPAVAPFDEAVEWFSKRTVITRAQWDALAKDARRRAFFVSGVARADIVRDVYRAIAKALKDGSTLAEFRTGVGPKLLDAWQGDVDTPAWRMETIYRKIGRAHV